MTPPQGQFQHFQTGRYRCANLEKSFSRLHRPVIKNSALHVTLCAILASQPYRVIWFNAYRGQPYPVNEYTLSLDMNPPNPPRLQGLEGEQSQNEKTTTLDMTASWDHLPQDLKSILAKTDMSSPTAFVPCPEIERALKLLPDNWRPPSQAESEDVRAVTFRESSSSLRKPSLVLQEKVEPTCYGSFEPLIWKGVPKEDLAHLEEREREPLPTASPVSKPAECSVCLEAPAANIFTPCGHQCVCGQCGLKIIQGDRRCPICRATTESCIRVFT
eukprot:g60052.t1